MSSAVGEMEAEILLFVVGQLFCICSFMVLKSLLIINNFFYFILSTSGKSALGAAL